MAAPQKVDLRTALRAFLDFRMETVVRRLEYDLDQMLTWADYVIVAQKPSQAHAERIKRSGRRLVNLLRAPGRVASTELHPVS